MTRVLSTAATVLLLALQPLMAWAGPGEARALTGPSAAADEQLQIEPTPPERPQGLWLWGLLAPGLGQVALGDSRKGLAIGLGALASILCGGLAGWGLDATRTATTAPLGLSVFPEAQRQPAFGVSSPPSPGYVMWGGLAGLLGALTVWGMAAVDAYDMEQRQRWQERPPFPRWHPLMTHEAAARPESGQRRPDGVPAQP